MTLSNRCAPLTLGKISESISFLKGWLPLLIVCLHAYFPEENNYTFTTLWASDLMYFFSRILTMAAVPAFFLISGYLFFNKKLNKLVIVGKWKDRLKTLLIPYLLWNLIYLIFQILKPLILGDSFNLRTYQWDFETILSAFYNFDGSFPIDAPLWFIRDLMIMCLFTPVINWITKKTPLVIFLWLFFAFKFNGFPLFLIGSWLAFYKDSIAKFVSRNYVLPISVALYIVMCILKLVNKDNFNPFYNSFFVLLSVFCALEISFIFSRYRFRILIDTSFWIYAIHALIISLVDKLIFKIYYPQSDFYFVLFYFIKIILTYILALILYSVLKKILPSVLKILTGAREKSYL